MDWYYDDRFFRIYELAPTTGSVNDFNKQAQNNHYNFYLEMIGAAFGGR